jgi:non-specific serine/threonine protein kinase/serine/threonine-protein kinase
MTDSERVRRIFDEVADLPAGDRSARLDVLCADAPAVRAEVEALLAHDASPGDEIGGAVHRAAGELSLEGTTVGPYRLGKRIGTGGMGEVYAAEQVEPVRRSVALKLIKPGLDTERVVARFEAERHALARMEHSAIARILDAGATERGRPYFVMERVDGPPITEYCDAERLEIRERIELFLRVCAGVQHAHRRGILHRDLKPSNILVTVEDGRPMPKIIDFGVAKATRADSDGLTTVGGGWVGTPDYMSPEQVEGGTDRLDTRSDVYSLGVVLYELLVGKRPFARPLRSGSTPAELREAILTEDPPTPARAASTVDAEVAAARREDRGSLVRTLRGDLDWVVMRALEKDPERRYDTPAALALDLERILAHEPVEAGPPTAAYRVGKFVRRHRVAVSVATLVVAALLLGIAGTTYGLLRAREAEAAARQEAETNRRVAAFLDSTLRGLRARRIGRTMVEDLRERSGDREALDRGLAGVNVTDAARRTLDREVLARASSTIEEELAEDPGVAAELRYSLSRAYDTLGDEDESERQAREAYRLALEAGVPTDAVALKTAHQWHVMLLEVGEYDEGLALAREQLAICVEAFGDADRRTLRMREDVAAALKVMGEFPEAAEEFGRLWELYRADAEATVTATCSIGENYGSTLALAGEAERGAEVLRAVLDMRRADGQIINGAETRIELGRALLISGRFEEAEAELLDAHATLAERRGEEHGLTNYAVSILGALYGNWERWDVGLEWARTAYESRLQASGPDHVNTSYGRIQYGKFLMNVGRLAEARELLEEAARRLESRSPPHNARFYAYIGLGELARVEGRLAESEKIFERTLVELREEFGDGNIDVRECHAELARTLIELGRAEEAEPHLRTALDGLSDGDLGVDFRLTNEARLAGVLRMLGREDEAEAQIARVSADVETLSSIKPSTRAALAFGQGVP